MSLCRSQPPGAWHPGPPTAQWSSVGPAFNFHKGHWLLQGPLKGRLQSRLLVPNVPDVSSLLLSTLSTHFFLREKHRYASHVGKTGELGGTVRPEPEGSPLDARLNHCGAFKDPSLGPCPPKAI